MGNLDFSANADQLKELAAYMASQINVPTIGIGGGYAPIGSINFFDATTAPQDWLACDGTVYNIADYPQLADWYEAQHGSKNFYGGDGTTTFAVPDLQGEFLRGTGPTNTSFLICVKAVVAGEVYSTEERVVGTWIDGKPLYQKVISTTLGTDNQTKTIPLNISIGFFQYQSFVTRSDLYQEQWENLLSIGTLWLDNNNININHKRSDYNNKYIIIIFQYTKTTD